VEVVKWAREIKELLEDYTKDHSYPFRSYVLS